MLVFRLVIESNMNTPYGVYRDPCFVCNIRLLSVHFQGNVLICKLINGQLLTRPNDIMINVSIVGSYNVKGQKSRSRSCPQAGTYLARFSLGIYMAWRAVIHVIDSCKQVEDCKRLL